MSRRVAPFNRLEVTSGVLDRIQFGKDELIADRLTDAILQAGINVPVGATARDIENGLDGSVTPAAIQFSLVATSGVKLTVGPGIAYDANGNRIQLLSGDLTSFNPNGPTFTATISGVGPIQGTVPYSTGRVDAFDPASSADGERFVFVRYAEVVRTKSLPPNHATPGVVPPGPSPTSVTLVGGDPNTKKPVTELDEREGLIYAPHRIDGYEVIIVDITGLTPASQPTPNTPVLAADTNAVYVGRYTLTAGLVVGASIVLNDDDRPRKVLQLRPREVGLVQSDPTKRPTQYDLDEAKTLDEHVGALGTGIVAPTNPHGLAIADITGGGLEPENIVYQKESLADGIVDEGVFPDNPIPVTAALDPIISNTAIPATSFVARVEFSTGANGALAVGQSVYISGERFTTIVPTFASIPNKSVVGFQGDGAGGGDAEGTYTIYLVKSVTGVATLAKTTGALPADTLPLVEVFWQNSSATTQLRRTEHRNTALSFPTTDAQEATPRPVEERSFGLVSLAQVSTEGLADPVRGFFAQQALENRLYNPDFYIVNGFGWTLTNVTGVATMTRVDYLGLFPGDLMSANPGPKSITALRVEFPASAPSLLLHTKVTGLLSNLKPNTTYTVSAWIKVTTKGNPAAPVNTSISFVGGLLNGGGTLIGKLKDFRFANNTTSWQRVAITLQTDATVTPITNNRLDLRFISQDLPSFVTADVYLANVMVTEGEWITGPLHADQMDALTCGDFYAADMYGAWGQTTRAVAIAHTAVSRGQIAVIHCHTNVLGTVRYNGFSTAGFTAQLEIWIDGALQHYSFHRLSLSAGFAYAGNEAGAPHDITWRGLLNPGSHLVQMQIYVEKLSNGAMYFLATQNHMEVQLL